MTIRVAVTGTGFIAGIHARAIQANKNAELVAVVGHDAARTATFARKYGITGVYFSIEELIKSGEADAAVIGTPNALHFAQTMAALKAGLAVMVEKPMAMNAREAEQMFDASRRYKRPLMVAQCWRFHRDVLWLKKQVIAKKLGCIIRTKAYGVHTHWGPSGWFTQKALAGGGALIDMGVHAVDTTRFLIGDPNPSSVYARIGTYYMKADVDDTGVIIVNWANGVTSYIEAGWWQPHRDGEEAATQLYADHGFGSVFPTRLEIRRSANRRVKVTRPGFRFPIAGYSLTQMYGAQMNAFIESVEHDGTPTPGGLEGWINMLILDAAYASAQSGKVVEVRI